jgi:hypothetical protein
MLPPLHKCGEETHHVVTTLTIAAPFLGAALARMRKNTSLTAID